LNDTTCQYSHGWKEQEYHPLNYKINKCKHGDACTKKFCPFYHSEKDRRFPLPSVYTVVPKNRNIAFPSQGYPSQHCPQTQPNVVVVPSEQQPSAYVGSPMEGLRFSPYSSPVISPYASPHESPKTSPRDLGNCYIPTPAIYQSTSPGAMLYTNNQQYNQPVFSSKFYKSKPEEKEKPIESPPPGLGPRLTTSAKPFIPKRKEAEAHQFPVSQEKRLSPVPSEESKIVSPGLLQIDQGVILNKNKKAEQEQIETLKQFLQENKLSHLYHKLTQYVLSGNNWMQIQLTDLNKLGIEELQDKNKLLEAIDRTQKAGQRALASIQDF